MIVTFDTTWHDTHRGRGQSFSNRHGQSICEKGIIMQKIEVMVMINTEVNQEVSRERYAGILIEANVPLGTSVNLIIAVGYAISLGMALIIAESWVSIKMISEVIILTNETNQMIVHTDHLEGVERAPDRHQQSLQPRMVILIFFF